MIIKKNSNITLRKETSVSVKAGIEAVITLEGSGIFIIDVERNAKVRVMNMANKTKQLDQRLDIHLVGVGAEAIVAGTFHGTGSARHMFTVTMHHKAKRTRGDILLKGVYEGSSRGFFTGLIKIDATAANSNSYFTDKVLLLDDAMATSIPTLEIEADEVKASHGSTTGTIDENQLFYLTSRGLNFKQAKRMIINGFLQQVQTLIPTL